MSGKYVSVRDVRRRLEDWQDYSVELRKMLSRIHSRRRCVWCGGVGEHEDTCELDTVLRVPPPMENLAFCSRCGSIIKPRNSRAQCGMHENPACYRAQRAERMRGYFERMSDEKRQHKNALRRKRRKRARDAARAEAKAKTTDVSLFVTVGGRLASSGGSVDGAD